MNKSFRKLILPVSILAALQVNALGLGNLQVDSALDEVLIGEIPMIISSEENVEDIQVSLASSSDYDRVGLDKSYVPSNIEVKITDKENKKFIEISSRGPVSEPIVSLLLVVDWANGHLLREYTILLDPPLFNNTQKEQNYSQPVKTQTYTPTEISETKNDVTISQTIPEEKVQVETTSNSSVTTSQSPQQATQVVVESGDTLWNIANRFNGGFSSPQQMMVAIFNNNPTAFRNDDMNLLKKGAVLEIPNSDNVSMISNGQAIAEVKSHVQNWSRLQTQESNSGTSTNSDVDYGIELVPPSDSESSNQNTGSNSSTNRAYDRAVADLNLAREELASSEQENAELSSRVTELEAIVKDQELAMSFKDSDLALLQQQLVDSEKDNAQSTLAENNSTDDVWGNDNSTISDTENSEIDAEIEIENENENNENVASEVTTIVDEPSSDTQVDDSNEAVAISDVDEKPETTTQVKPPVTRVAEKSLMDKVLDYKYEGLIGLGVLLLGGLGFMYYKRKEDDEYEAVETGGFLDTISNRDTDTNIEIPEELKELKDLEDGADEVTVDDFETEESSDDDIGLDLSELDEVELGADDSVDEMPEVVVMDDEVEEAEEIGLDEDDFGLSLDEDEVEDINLDIDESENEESDSSEDLDDLDFNIEEMDLDMDEDQADDLELSVISSEDESSEDDTQEESADLSMDFDLDDFDFDTDDSEDGESEAKETTEQLLEDDFDLDLEIGAETLDLDEVATDTEELEDLVFDTGERTVVPDDSEELTEQDSSEENTSEEDLGELEFDMDDMFSADDLDLENSPEDNSESLEDSMADVELDDLGDLDVVDMDIDGGSESEDGSMDFDDSEEIDIGLDFDDLIGDDAIDTKLDLAKAYFEMGDIDGAKQMVVEIIEEGSDEQKVKAEELKSEIESS